MALSLIALGIIVGLVVIVALVFFYYYNKFVTLSNRVENSLSQINVQLKRRADLIPNLVKTVKSYAKHEKKVFDDVNKARKSLMNSQDVDKKVKANNQLEGALKNLFAIAENYPDLKANQNYMELQRELSATEDKIAYARQHYNDSILSYNTLCESLPGRLFAKLYGRGTKEYLDIPEPEKKVPEVNL